MRQERVSWHFGRAGGNLRQKGRRRRRHDGQELNELARVPRRWLTRKALLPAVDFRLLFTCWCPPLRCHGRAESGWPCDGVLVETSLQQEAKATANGRRELVVLLKQRRTFVCCDIHSEQTGPVLRDSPNLQRRQVLSRTEGDRWQVRRTWWWQSAGGARKSLTKNQS